MNQLLKLGIIVVLLVILVSLLAQFLAPYNPWKRFDAYLTPCDKHWLGTNDLGHDIFSELLVSTRVSLMVALIAALISSLAGLILGLTSGYFKNNIDNIIMGLTDIFLTIPKIPLLILLTAFFKPSYWMTAIILGLLWWPSTTMVVRSKTKQVREMAFIESDQCLGFRSRFILFSEILPNIQEIVFPKFLINLATAMTAEASISFLGLGDPSSKSWGMMINFAFVKGGFVNNMWWWYLPPGLCIMSVVFVIMWLGLRVEEKQPNLYGVYNN